MPIRTRPLLGSDRSTSTSGGVYGSTTATTFIRDLMLGNDSVDIITLGDSNNMRGDYGYNGGWHRALGYYCGSTMYASPLYSGSNYLSGAPSGNQRGDYAWGTGTYQSWPTDNTAGRVGNVRALILAAAGGDTNASAIKTYLGFDSTNYTDDATTRLPRTHGWQWAGAFVADGVTYSSFAGDNYVQLKTTCPLNYGTGSGAASLRWRVVYGTFATGSGQFKMRVRNSDGSTTDGSTFTTNTGAAGYLTASLNFSTASGTLLAVSGFWDGFSATVADQAKGPVAILWQGFAKQSGKGHAVSSLIGHSGITTVGIADRIEYMDKLLDCYLKEIIDRQVLAGGSGRAIIFMNSGINDTTPSTTWTPAADRIVARIKQRWAVAGGSLANLAFVFTVTHPTTAQGAWDAGRAAAAIAANTWGSGNISNNATVVDLAVNYPGYKMLNGVSGAGGNLYDGAGAAQAHLSVALTQLNGYDAMVGDIVSSMLASY